MQMVSLGWVGRYYQRSLHQYIPCRVERRLRRLRRLFAGYCGFVATAMLREVRQNSKGPGLTLR